MDFEILSTDTLYKGFFKLEKYQVRHALFQGGWSPVIEREVFERGHAVALLPYDPETDQVVMVEQFRVAAHENPKGPWLLEVVAGMMSPGESPPEVVNREAKEETGLKVTDLTPIYQYYVSPGGTTEQVHLFVGRVKAGEAVSYAGLADEQEDIRVQVLDFEAAMDALATGRTNNGTSIIALQWLALNRAKIRQNWLEAE